MAFLRSLILAINSISEPQKLTSGPITSSKANKFECKQQRKKHIGMRVRLLGTGPLTVSALPFLFALLSWHFPP